MSLKWRLFLVFGGLLTLLLLAQGWLVRTLANDLSGELGEVAFVVGTSVAAVFVKSDSRVGVGDCAGEPCAPEVFEHRDPRVKVFQWSSREKDEDADPERGHHIWIDGTSGEGAADHSSFVFQLDEAGDSPVLSIQGSGSDRRIPVPQQGFREKLDRFARRLFAGSLLLLVLGLVLAAVIAGRIARPLEALASAAREVGAGTLGAQVTESTGGEVGRAIGAFNQMSRRLGELEARHRELEARRHLGEIGDVARGLAHALRNPLNALGLSVEELAGKASAEGAELAASARRQVRRMDHAIRSFLALASEGRGLQQEVDLGELAEDVALEVLQDGRGRTRVEVEKDPEGLCLLAVPAELRAVLQALVVNAVEASPEGGRVRIAVRGSAGRLRVEVDDEGPGLAPEIRAQLFTPHVSTKADGSGMGLFLAHRIATARYGGDLALVDLEPRGTRARLEISARREEVEGG